MSPLEWVRFNPVDLLKWVSFTSSPIMHKASCLLILGYHEESSPLMTLRLTLSQAAWEWSLQSKQLLVLVT